MGQFFSHVPPKREKIQEKDGLGNLRVKIFNAVLPIPPSSLCPFPLVISIQALRRRKIRNNGILEGSARPKNTPTHYSIIPAFQSVCAVVSACSAVDFFAILGGRRDFMNFPRREKGRNQ
jgi:hypothetical protein